MSSTSQRSEKHLSGELGMKWYHFFKWWLVIAGSNGIFSFFNTLFYAAALAETSVSAYLSFMFDFAPLYTAFWLISFTVDLCFVVTIASSLFKYKSTTYKFCFFYLMWSIVSFVVTLATQYFYNLSFDSVTIGSMFGSLIGKFIFFLPSVYYLKKRSHGFVNKKPLPPLTYATVEFFCPHCEKSILLDSTFCTFCGKQIGSKSEM